MDCKYNVLIIGAGEIGAFRDISQKQHVLTHAHAFSIHKNFNLLGFLDLDINKAQSASSLWGGAVFKSLDEVFSFNEVNVVSVAVPDELHYSVLMQLAPFNFNLLFVEKPLARNFYEAQEIINIYQKKNIPIVVNYTRRFIPEFEKLKKDFCDGLYGKYVCGTGYYGKGILHNGSHLIDFLLYFFGIVKCEDVISGIYDFYSDDPSIAAVLLLENKKPFVLQVVDCNFHTIFEIDLLFEKKRIRVVDFGEKIEIYEIAKNKTFKNYEAVFKSKEINTSYNKFMYYAAENICNYLSKKENLRSTEKNSYETMKICLKLRTMFKSK